MIYIYNIYILYLNMYIYNMPFVRYTIYERMALGSQKISIQPGRKTPRKLFVSPGKSMENPSMDNYMGNPMTKAPNRKQTLTLEP